MSDDKKPEAFEAWIAWHPIKGFDVNSLGIYECREAVQRFIDFYNNEIKIGKSKWEVRRVEVRPK